MRLAAVSSGRAWPALALVIACLADAAAAENPETEHRLKAAGVDDALRRDVHRAIAAGVKSLLSVQGADGSFDPREGAVAQEPHLCGWTALCGLGLRHSGLPDGLRGARSALAYLYPKADRPRLEVLQRVHSASLAAMLAQADGRTAAAPLLASALARGQASTGWWSYGIPGDGFELSATQHAILGLGAARRGGAHVEESVWSRHLDSLIRLQMPDGSWSYGGVVPMSYPTGTFMGLANLLQTAEQWHPGEMFERCRDRALRALERDVGAALDGFAQGWLRDYFALFAMERACVFLRVEQVGGRRWYVEGARALVDAQQGDGSWSGRDYRYWSTTPPERPRGDLAARGAGFMTSVEATAFALLFLVRAPESEQVTTPRPVDWVVTARGESEGDTPAPPAKPVAGPPEVPFDLAMQHLEILEQQVKDGNVAAKELETSVLAVSDASDRLAANGAAAAWRDRAARVMLQVVRLRVKGSDATVAQVRILALRALGGMDSDVSPRLVRVIEESLFPASEAERDALYAEAFRSLARLNRIDAFRWLRDDVIGFKGTRDSAARTIAALDALARFTGVPGTDRLHAFQRLLHSCPRSREASAANTGPIVPDDGMDVRVACIVALQRLGVDPKTGLAPRVGPPACGWAVTMRDFERWFVRHDDPKAAPWGG